MAGMRLYPDPANLTYIAFSWKNTYELLAL